jgi:hypothetical protein
MPSETIRTRDVRPWWWWVNPWLYIKRRDTAYDDALDSLYELAVPYRKAEEFTPGKNPALDPIAGMCRSCGCIYVRWIVERSTNANGSV